MATFVDRSPLAQLQPLVGTRLGPSSPVVVSQDRITEFASVTDDSQWIHTDPERAARESPYGGTVAHGFLTLSLLSRFLEELLDVREVPAAVNYGLDRVRFPAPVLAGSTVCAMADVLSVDVDERGVLLAARVIMTADRGSKPVCVADSLTLYPISDAA